MYLAREHTGASLPAIGAEFGGRGHTTVLHACRRTAERVAADPEASQTVARASRTPVDNPAGRPGRPRQMTHSTVHRQGRLCAAARIAQGFSRAIDTIDSPYDV